MLAAHTNNSRHYDNSQYNSINDNVNYYVQRPVGYQGLEGKDGGRAGRVYGHGLGYLGYDMIDELDQEELLYNQGRADGDQAR